VDLVVRQHLADLRDPLAEGSWRRTRRCLWRSRGAGGQSAFGTKAGDVFTRITIGIAVAWVAMAVLTGYAMSYESGNTRYPGAAESNDAATEGAVDAKGGPVKPNPFEKGAEDQAAPKDAKKATETTTPAKSSPAPSDKSAPATKGTSTTTPEKSK
jgi:preprotein translocase subunit SecG